MNPSATDTDAPIKGSDDRDGRTVVADLEPGANASGGSGGEGHVGAVYPHD